MKAALVLFALLTIPELVIAQDNWALPGGDLFHDEPGGGGEIPLWLAVVVCAGFCVVFGEGIGLWRSIILIASIIALYGTWALTLKELGVLSLAAGLAAMAVVWKVMHAILPVPDDDEKG